MFLFCGLFHDVVTIADCAASVTREVVNEVLERIQREIFVALDEVLFRHLPVGTEDNYKAPLRIADLPAEIRNRHIPSITLDRYYGSNNIICSKLLENVFDNNNNMKCCMGR